MDCKYITHAGFCGSGVLPKFKCPNVTDKSCKYIGDLERENIELKSTVEHLRNKNKELRHTLVLCLKEEGLC